jgi:hypothetical protein
MAAWAGVGSASTGPPGECSWMILAVPQRGDTMPPDVPPPSAIEMPSKLTAP